MKPQKEINIIDNWLEQYGNPEIDKFLEKNLAIADKVNAVLKERSITKTVFAQMLGKKPSEVSKWLTGMHNITLKSITKMETVLEVNLINIEPEIEIKYVYLGSIKGDNIKNAINEHEEVQYENTNCKYA